MGFSAQGLLLYTTEGGNKMVKARYNHEVTADSLTCLFDRCEAEIVPEPFRLQSDTVFSVAYSEYINYVSDLDATANIQLSAPIIELKRLVTQATKQLYSQYLADLAFANIKEVYFAEEYNADGSLILPVSYESKPIALDFFVQYLCPSNIERIMSDIAAISDGSIYVPCRLKRPHNKWLATIACGLYEISTGKGLTSDLNLVCGTA